MDSVRALVSLIQSSGGLVISALVAGIVLWLVASVIWPATARVLGLFPAALLAVLGVAAAVLWFPVSILVDLLFLVVPIDRLMQAVLWASARDKGPLFDGKGENYAKLVWPPARYPDLYEQVPPDIERPVFEDGRLLGGFSITWLADRYFTRAAYRSAVRIGFKGGALAFLLALALLLAGPLANTLDLALSAPHLSPIIEQWPGDNPVRWSGIRWLEAGERLELHHAAELLLSSAPYLIGSALAATGLGIILMMVVLGEWHGRMAAPYRQITKDADVRWPFRIETRELLRETYRRQLKHAMGRLKDAPIYELGRATGTLRTRGDLTAPTPGQAVALDGESLFQHLLVFGGTGEGKTTALLKPLMREVLKDRKFGAYVSDAKGVLWRDAERIAASLGRAEDVVVIGTGEAAKSVNVVAGLTPSQIAATLRSVLAQIGTGKHDSFWPDMAANAVRHMLTLGRSYALTESGKASIANGLHPYSLWWAYQAVMRPAVVQDAIKALHEAGLGLLEIAEGKHPLSKKQEALALHLALLNSEVKDTIEYLEGPWTKMASETKSGIVAGVTQLLDGLSGAPELRKRFASGIDEGTISLSEALNGKIVLNALSTVEDGMPARVISILIKTTLYREARKREAEMKTDPLGRGPQDAPCLVVMDEIQELATVDPTSGLSDATFWNVARSAGLAGVFATQTLAALEQSMGEDAARNFIQQARSKVFFRTEEPATVDYACWSAGEYERNRVFGDGHRESLDYRMLIDGWEPFEPVDESAKIPAGPSIFFSAAKAVLDPASLSLTRLERASPFEVDLRFVPGAQPSGDSFSNAATYQARQAAHWRSEDLNREYRSQGNEVQKALSNSDIIHMGRWHAFAHVQRAGASRQDIIAVTHDFS